MINLNRTNNFNKATKCYLANSCLVFFIVCSILLMFFIQFRVDNLQTKVNEATTRILSLDNEIRVLEVEWVYLTRPARLRILSKKYLYNNGYIASNQVKDEIKLQSYYIANIRKNKNIAMNDNAN